ncbi:MAG: hypothetical protein JO267_12545 [Alphaproteobacteria bacterium]|nr:hypothetical protein [Alphaproteobacteria bacterium]
MTAETGASAAAQTPAYDPAAVAQLLVATGAKLTQLLAAETDLLRASRTGETAALCNEKTRLSQVFAAGWRQFQTRPDTIDQLPAELRCELLEVARQVNAAALDNEQMLRVGRRAAELVLAAIARAVAQQRPKPTYTAGRTTRMLVRDQAGLGLNRSA